MSGIQNIFQKTNSTARFLDQDKSYFKLFWTTLVQNRLAIVCTKSYLLLSSQANKYLFQSEENKVVQNLFLMSFRIMGLGKWHLKLRDKIKERQKEVDKHV